LAGALHIICGFCATPLGAYFTWPGQMRMRAAAVSLAMVELPISGKSRVAGCHCEARVSCRSGACGIGASGRRAGRVRVR